MNVVDERLGNRTLDWSSGRTANPPQGSKVRANKKAAGPRWTPRPGTLRSLDRRVSWRCGVGCDGGWLVASAVSARAERQSCAGCRNGLATEHVRAHLQIRLRGDVHLQDTHLLTRVRARPLGLAHCFQGHMNTMPGCPAGPTLFPNFLQKLCERVDTWFRNVAPTPRWRGSSPRICRSSPGRSRPPERARRCPTDGSLRWRRASRR